MWNCDEQNGKTKAEKEVGFRHGKDWQRLKCDRKVLTDALFEPKA